MAAQEQVLNALRTEHLHADLKGRSVRGGLLTVGSQGTQFLLQSIATVALARLLAPAEFGIVAMVTAITGLGQAFADLGLSEATIQHTEISDDQISTLFWVNVAIGFGLMLVTLALAPVLVWFYKEPRLRNITFLMSLTFFFGGLRVQHGALLKRQMRFLALAIRDVLSYVVAVPLAITLAWKGAGYWALVALPLTLNFLQMSLSWLTVRWLPGLPRRHAKVHSLISFGGNVAASYLVTNVTRSSDSVLTGWYWGAGPLGLYSRAYNLLMLPVRQLSSPAGSVAIPAFSRVQDDPERFARYYLRAASLILWITTPIFGFLFVAAQPTIVLVLGTKWESAAPVFQILAVAGLGQPLFELTMWSFISRGESQRLLRMMVVICPILVTSYAIGLPFGIKGVALCGSLVFLALLPWIFRFSFRGTNLTLQRLGRAIVFPISLSLSGVASATLSLNILTPQTASLHILIAAFSFAIGYLLPISIPRVRREITDLRSVLSELRLSKQAV
jgi:PST family polysaccharide transporter